VKSHPSRWIGPARCAGAFLGIALLTVSPFAFAEVSMRLGAGVEYFNWREYDDLEHRKAVDETGPRAVATLDLSAGVARRTDLIVRGRLYGGEVDYDGELNDPAHTPLSSKTDYLGLAVEGGFSFKPRNHRGDTASVILTFGVDDWTRELKGIYGYDEEYTIMFVRLGAEAQDRRWTARGGMLLPVDADEHIDVWGGLDLKPETNPWFYIGVGYRFNEALELALDYQGYRFDVSDPVAVDVDGDGAVDGYAWQPRSEQDTLTITLRAGF